VECWSVKKVEKKQVCGSLFVKAERELIALLKSENEQLRKENEQLRNAISIKG
jgi:hypothetical protein